MRERQRFIDPRFELHTIVRLVARRASTQTLARHWGLDTGGWDTEAGLMGSPAEASKRTTRYFI